MESRRRQLEDLAWSAEAERRRGTKSLQARAQAVLDKAERAGDLRAVTGAIRELRGILELQGKLLGELRDTPAVAIVTTPEWIRIRATLLDVLQRHPEL